MPLLGGLFSKKNKSTSRLKGDDYGSTTATSSNVSSPTISSYITPDSSVPSYPNAQGGFSGGYGQGAYPNHLKAPLMSTSPSSTSSAGHAKRRFFGRKKSGQHAAAQSSPDFQSTAYSTPERPAHQARATSSETDPSDVRRLRPPPSRSAIFAAYGDPTSALSTRSLPNDNSFPSDSSLSPPSPSPVSAPAKRPSLFAWGGKSSPKSPSGDSSLISNDMPESPADSSFNLKSFRHIRPPSPPSQPADGPNVLLAAPIPRPRGASVASDASQRISVAAFREAQARRSLAGSPSPSFRDSSPIPPLPSRSMTPEGPRGPVPRPSRSTTSIPQNAQRRRSSMAVASTTEDSDSSEVEDSDDESVYRGGHHRQRSDKIKAKSELGHGYTVESSFKRHDLPLPTRGPRSHSGHSVAPSSRPTTQYDVEDNSRKNVLPPRSQSSLGHFDEPRERASTSISSISPSVSAHRAATLATANSAAAADRKVTPTQAMYSQQTTRGRGGIYPAPTNSDSGSDSDDAPLATLVAPRRPGSAMSSHSNPSLRSAAQSSGRSPNPPKPLIDINELTRGPMPTRAVTSPPKSDAGFTKGPTLLSQGQHTSSPLGGSPSSEHPPPLTQKVPPVNFALPVDTPLKEPKEFISPASRSSIDMLANSLSAPTRDSSPEQKRDVFSDRLAKVVKKSLTSPIPTASPPSLPSSPPIATPVSRDVSPFPGSGSDTSQPRSKTEPSRLPRNPPPVIRPQSESPPDEDLAELLGMGGIKFISRAGEEPDSTSSESESESEHSDDSDTPSKSGRIAPIPIKQRSTPPAFAVTSRPSFPRQKSNGSSEITSPEVEDKSLSPSPFAPRQRSSTLSATTSATSFPSTKPSDSSLATSHNSSKSISQQVLGKGGLLSPPNSSNGNARPPIGGRQRSSTMISPVSPSKVPKQLSSLPQPPSKPFQLPDRPFIAVRRDSPGSSTGDSSSGRAPYTPGDGSELGFQDDRQSRGKKQDEWSGGASGLGIKRHNPKRRSVSFEDESPVKPPSKSHIREGARTGPEVAVDSNDEREERRRERRRSEAKAAIELGKVINGPGPVLDDDDDNLLPNAPMNNRMTTFNPMMPMGSPMGMPMGFPGAPGTGWPGNMSQSMLAPAQFMMPPPSDPNMFAAHQQAMMYAKQAYQMAVAQQAMAAAGEEWERGSAVGGYSGGGSVYGGSNAPSMMTSPYGMMGGMMQPNGWGGTGSVYGGPAPRFNNSMTTGGMVSSSRSEYGGGSRQSGNWASKSVYGESFGPSNNSGRKSGQTNSRPPSQMWGSPRDSNYFPPVPPMPASRNTNGRGSPDLKGSRQRTTSQPAINPGSPPRRAPPPSSWKKSGV